jgi:hypothetical protein
MTPATLPYYEPVAQNAYLGRLAVNPPRPDCSPVFWTNVHEEIQKQFTPLESEVRRQVPGIRVAAGRTKGDKFYLFSYLTFSTPDGTIDPVVVGITFTPSPQGVAVEADVSGETTGDLISAALARTVPNSREELLAEARESARGLCQLAGAIATALRDTSRRIE